jgi:Protein of unknown function (DUF3108)
MTVLTLSRTRCAVALALSVGLCLALAPLYTAASTPPAASPVTAASAPNAVFTLPAQLRAQYSGVGKYGKFPLSGSGLITWNSRSDSATAAGTPYDASLEIGALFYKSVLTSQGVVNGAGIHPRRTEEKNTGKTAVVIATDVANNRVSISGKEGFQPYDASGQDLLTVIAQLGVSVQTQPQWRIAGAQKTFAVYRPGGLKHWRFQSQGLQTLLINGVAVPTIYVVQLAEDGGIDQDDQHHLWLDPARHGFPIKLRKIKKGGDYVELTLKDWQERP